MSQWQPRSDEVFKCLWEMFQHCAQCNYIPVGVPAGGQLPVGICSSVTLPTEEQNLPLPVGICERAPVGDWLEEGIRSSAVMVGLSPTALPAVPLTNRRLITIYNNSEYPIYLGDSGICASTDLPLAASQPYSANLGDTIPLYGVAGVCEAGVSPCDIRILEGA